MELLLNMTIGGTVAACLILLIKRVLKNKLTPKWHFYIWIILAIRLMIPGLPESGFSLMNTVPTAQNFTTVQNEAPADMGRPDTGGASLVEGNLVMKSPVTGMEQRRSFSVPERGVNLLFVGWITGVVLMAGYLAGSYWIFSRRTKLMPECRDENILELFRECRAETGIQSDNIMLRFGGSTPLLHGIIKPTLLIPGGYSREELRHVLIHELCHYKHKDILINIICSAFLCAYWFNPVFWISFYTIRRDIEFLCDERVIEITGERKEYSKTLLKTALKRNQFLFATTSMQSGEKDVSKRIKHIAYFRKPKLWISVLAALVVLAAGAVCLTDASIGNTVNVEVGGGYYIKVPEGWIGSSGGELLFEDEKGESFGGAYYSQAELGENKLEKFKNFDSTGLLPNHSLVLERRVYQQEGDPLTMILYNVDHDAETAAQTAERNASGDDSPAESINRNYIFLLPDKTKDEVFTIWADSRQVTERQLMKIAKTLQQNPYPQGYQPETPYRSNWPETAEKLLRNYFKNYVAADMSMSSDISGYRIDSLGQYHADQVASWSVIYSNITVISVDYTLHIAFPDRYSFAGGGFDIGEGNKTKIYKDQLAVFKMDHVGNARFLGFVWPQDRSELGDDAAILHTINYSDPEQRPETLLKLKTPYLGNASKVGKLLGSLPLSEYSTGMELHTKSEPYGLTVNYDMTELGNKVFKSRPEKAKTDSNGWDPNPALKAQLYKNSAILLALIDNCSTVEFKVTGMSENGVPYTYYYWKDRETLQEELLQDPRDFADNQEAFTEFMNHLESVQMGN